VKKLVTESEPCFKLFMPYRSLATRIRPDFKNHSFNSIQTSITFLIKNDGQSNLRNHLFCNPRMNQTVSSFPSFTIWINKYRNWNTSINELILVLSIQSTTYGTSPRNIIAPIQWQCNRNRTRSITRMNIVLWSIILWRILNCSAIIGVGIVAVLLHAMKDQRKAST